MRTLPDGRIVFTAREKLPDSIPGYTQDPDDPCIWHMDYGQCQHRILGQKYICQSGRERVRDFCLLKQIKLQPPTCKYCTVETKIPSQDVDPVRVSHI